METTYSRLINHCRLQLQKEFIICGELIITYGQFLSSVNSVATMLLDRGISTGDRVIVESGNAANSLIGIVSSFAVGAIAVPLSGSDQETVKSVIKDCRPRAVILAGSCSSQRATSFDQISTQVFPATIDSINFAEIENRDKSITSNCPAIILYTSGTTSGKRRGVLVTHGNLFHINEYLTHFMKLSREVREYCLAPVDFAFGFGRARAILWIGGTLVVSDRLAHPVHGLVEIKQKRCNAISSVSAGFVLFLDHFESEFREIGQAIKWAEVSSMPLGESHRARLLNALPNARVVMSYGLTEAQRTAMVVLTSDEQRPGLVGESSPGVSICVRDDEGRFCNKKGSGEILVKGVNVANTYWNQPKAWAAKFIGDWMRTGDVGHIDAGGKLFVIGRQDDMINVGGNKVSPIEVEERLAPVMGDIGFCISGIRHSSGGMGDIVTLVVEGNEIPSLDRIRSCFPDRAQAHLIPGKVIFVKVLPRTRNGKIMRNKIENLLISKNLSEDSVDFQKVKDA